MSLVVHEQRGAEPPGQLDKVAATSASRSPAPTVALVGQRRAGKRAPPGMGRRINGTMSSHGLRRADAEKIETDRSPMRAASTSQSRA